MKKPTVSASKRGRPEIYTVQVCTQMVQRVKKSGQSLKRVLVDLNRKRSDLNQLKYVPLLVAMAKHGLNLRRKVAKVKKALAKK